MIRLLSNLLVCVVLLMPAVGLADGYVRMVGLPFEQSGNADINVYIQALYRLAIGMAAMLAVLRLIMAGAQYILSDVITSKDAAKRDIRTSLTGLLIVLSAVLILNTINPSLTQLDALDLAGLRSPEPPTPTKGVCELDPNSSSCCRKKGGTYALDTDGSSCDLGDIISPGTGGQSGVEDIDRADCVGGSSGLVWDTVNKVCRTSSKYEYIAFPDTPIMEGLDPNNPDDTAYIRVECSGYGAGAGWTFDPDISTEQCVRINF